MSRKQLKWNNFDVEEANIKIVEACLSYGGIQKLTLPFVVQAFLRGLCPTNSKVEKISGHAAWLVLQYYRKSTLCKYCRFSAAVAKDGQSAFM